MNCPEILAFDHQLAFGGDGVWLPRLAHAGKFASKHSQMQRVLRIVHDAN